jgi:hypothetical protein
MSLGQIYEGWKNHLLPEERKKDFIEHVSTERMNICNACEEHSANKKEYKSLRRDAHCTNCGCTLAAKTKCLTCECPLKKWMPQPMPEDDGITT